MEKPGFVTKGIYIHDGFMFEPRDQCPFHWTFADWKKTIDWYSSLGINAIEFSTMIEFLRIPSTDFEREKIEHKQEIVKYAHEKEMKTYFIVSTNVLSTVPEGEKPGCQIGSGKAVHLCPQSRENFKKTTEVNKYYIEQYKDADAFEIFAGDWGGCQCGRCSWRTYLRYVKEYHRFIQSMNSTADVYMNLWAVSYWGKNPFTDFNQPTYWRNIFERDMAISRKIIDNLSTVPVDINIALPCSNLYRPLAIWSYWPDRIPEWPDRDTIDRIHKEGRKVIAWPHFIMDDDAYRIEHWGRVHSQVGYLKQLTTKLKDIGVDGIIGNNYWPRLQLLNTYAFARLCDNPGIEVTRILKDFSKLIASDPETLCRILVLIENYDGFMGAGSLPTELQLKHPKPALSLEQALNEVKKIKTRAPALPIPVSSDNFLNNLEQSLRRMQTLNQEI